MRLTKSQQTPDYKKWIMKASNGQNITFISKRSFLLLISFTYHLQHALSEINKNYFAVESKQISM